MQEVITLRKTALTVKKRSEERRVASPSLSLSFTCCRETWYLEGKRKRKKDLERLRRARLVDKTWQKITFARREGAKKREEFIFLILPRLSSMCIVTSIHKLGTFLFFLLFCCRCREREREAGGTFWGLAFLHGLTHIYLPTRNTVSSQVTGPGKGLRNKMENFPDQVLLYNVHQLSTLVP